MDLVDFQLFISISETCSVTHGAERTHLSLQAASARVKNLEDRVGTKLLYRTNQGVVLTPAGEIFLRHARGIISESSSMQNELRDFINGVKGRVRICTNGTATREFLPFALREFLLNHAQVDIQMITLSGSRASDEIIQHVIDGKADVGIYTKNLPAEGLLCLPYKTDRIVLVTNPCHPLATRTSVSFEEAIDYEFVGVHSNNAIYIPVYRVAASLQKALRVRVDVATYDAVIRLVQSNIGIGILPDTFARTYASTLRIVELEDAWALRHWNICYRKQKSGTDFVNRLVQFLIDKENEQSLSATARL